MIHRGYRSLDEAPRLMGFTLGQWGRLILLAGGVIGGVLVLGLPLKAAISVCAVLIGVPGALAYVSEPGGVRWGRLVVDLGAWRLRRRYLRCASALAGRSRDSR